MEDFRSKLIKELRRVERDIKNGVPHKPPCDGNHIDEKYFHDQVGFCHFIDCLSLQGIGCDCDFELHMKTPNKLFKRWD